jgi:hypothetical protein
LRVGAAALNKTEELEDDGSMDEDSLTAPEVIVSEQGVSLFTSISGCFK